MAQPLRNSWLAILALLCSSRAAPLDIVVLASKPNIDFTRAQTDQKIGTFLILNPSLGNVAAYLKFGNDCNVKHFREANLSLPLQNVRLQVNGVVQPALWTRGSDCTAVLTWSPAGPAPYLSTYQVDVLTSWNASTINLAGTYSESISITAINIP